MVVRDDPSVQLLLSTLSTIWERNHHPTQGVVPWVAMGIEIGLTLAKRHPEGAMAILNRLIADDNGGYPQSESDADELIAAFAAEPAP